MKKLIIFLACLLLVGVVSAAVPVLNTVTLTSTSGNNYTTDDLLCYANATDGDGDKVNYAAEWHLNGSLYRNLEYNVSIGATIRDSIVDSNDDLIVVGNSSVDIFMAKYDSSGSQTWSKTIDVAGGTDSAYGVDIDDSDNIYVVGDAGNDVYVAKYDSSGTHIFNFTYDYNGNSDLGRAIVVDSSSNIYFGVGVDDGAEEWQIIFKHNASGSYEWNITATATTSASRNHIGVAVDSEDNVVFGYTPTAHNMGALKVYPNGTIIWNQTCNDVYDGYTLDVAIGRNDSVVIGGYFHVGPKDGFHVCKMYSNGTTMWDTNNNLDLTTNDRAFRVALDNSDNIYLAGHSGSSTGILIKYDAQGNDMWYKYFSGKSSDRVYSVAVDSNDNVIYTPSTGRAVKYSEFASTSVQTQGTTSLVATLDGSVTAEGDNWSCVVWAYDGVNVTSKIFSTGNLTVTSDSTPPEIADLRGDWNTTKSSGTFYLNVTADESISGNSTMWINTSEMNCTATTDELNCSHVVGSLPEGNLTNITVQLCDVFGNCQNISSGSWVFKDSTPPSFTVSSPTSTNYTTSTNISLNISLNDAVDTWWYTIDSGATNTTFTPNTTFIAPQGDITLIVYANDSMGNENSSTILFSVDTIGPNVTIHSPISQTYTTNLIDIEVSADETVDTWWYTFDLAENITFTPNITLTLPDNTYNLYVSANDTWGHINTTNVTFTVNVPVGGGGGASPSEIPGYYDEEDTDEEDTDEEPECVNGDIRPYTNYIDGMYYTCEETCVNGRWSECIYGICSPRTNRTCIMITGEQGLQFCGSNGLWGECVLCLDGSVRSCILPSGMAGVQVCENQLWGDCELVTTEEMPGEELIITPEPTVEKMWYQKISILLFIITIIVIAYILSKDDRKVNKQRDAV